MVITSNKEFCAPFKAIHRVIGDCKNGSWGLLAYSLKNARLRAFENSPSMFLIKTKYSSCMYTHFIRSLLLECLQISSHLTQPGYMGCSIDDKFRHISGIFYIMNHDFRHVLKIAIRQWDIVALFAAPTSEYFHSTHGLCARSSHTNMTS